MAVDIVQMNGKNADSDMSAHNTVRSFMSSLLYKCWHCTARGTGTLPCRFRRLWKLKIVVRTVLISLLSQKMLYSSAGLSCIWAPLQLFNNHSKAGRAFYLFLEVLIWLAIRDALNILCSPNLIPNLLAQACMGTESKESQARGIQCISYRVAEDCHKTIQAMTGQLSLR